MAGFGGGEWKDFGELFYKVEKSALLPTKRADLVTDGRVKQEKMVQSERGRHYHAKKMFNLSKYKDHWYEYDQTITAWSISRIFTFIW